MPTPLSWYPLPPQHTRVGLHDDNQFGNNPPDVAAHGAAMRQRGLTVYKCLDDPTTDPNASGVRRAATYWHSHKIMPVIRIYKPQPHPDWIPEPAQIQVYRNALGIPPYIEAGNEPNLTVEQSRSLTPEMVADQFMKAANNIKAGGGIPVTYALSPGGNIDHRVFTVRFLDRIKAVGGTNALDYCAYGVHPRPHTWPPDTEPTGAITTAFNEFKWHADRLKERFGWVPPMILSEHGYSLGDGTNTGHPKIETPLWVAYNEELFRRADPAHPKSLPPYVFFLCYWKEIGGMTFGDNAYNGWCPSGATAWGQKIGAMGINWHYSITAALPLSEALIDEAKKRQKISPNPSAALEKAAYGTGTINAAISDEFEVLNAGKVYVAQLFYARFKNSAGALIAAERVYYCVKGDWGNVKFVTVYQKEVPA